MNEMHEALSQEQVDQIAEKLIPLTNVNDEVRSEHIQGIQRKLNDTEHCPRCGGRLVVRTVKNGENAGCQFYGCSNYPKCRYTRNMPSMNTIVEKTGEK